MLLLAARGHAVVGVEAIERPVRECAADHDFLETSPPARRGDFIAHTATLPVRLPSASGAWEGSKTGYTFTTREGDTAYYVDRPPTFLKMVGQTRCGALQPRARTRPPAALATWCTAKALRHRLAPAYPRSGGLAVPGPTTTSGRHHTPPTTPTSHRHPMAALPPPAPDRSPALPAAMAAQQDAPAGTVTLLHGDFLQINASARGAAAARWPAGRPSGTLAMPGTTPNARTCAQATGGADFAAVWDRGALVALPPARRDAYVERVHRLMKPGGRVLLVCCEHDVPPPTEPEALAKMRDYSGTTDKYGYCATRAVVRHRGTVPSSSPRPIHACVALAPV